MPLSPSGSGHAQDLGGAERIEAVQECNADVDFGGLAVGVSCDDALAEGLEAPQLGVCAAGREGRRTREVRARKLRELRVLEHYIKGTGPASWHQIRTQRRACGSSGIVYLSPHDTFGLQWWVGKVQLLRGVRI